MDIKAKNRKYKVLVICLVILCLLGTAVGLLFNAFHYNSLLNINFTSDYTKSESSRVITNTKYDYTNVKQRVLVKAQDDNFDSLGGEITLLENDTYLVEFDSEESANKFKEQTQLSCVGDDVIELQSSQVGKDVINDSEVTIDSELSNYLFKQNVMNDEVSIAVLDSGYAKDVVATDYADRVLEGRNFSATGGLNTNDDNGHGTDVTNLILEDTFSNVKVMPIKVLDSTGHGTIAALQLGLRYAIDSNVDIINISLATTSVNTEFIQELLTEAEEKGIVVVAAAGNYDSDVANYCPANIESVITVSSVDPSLKKSLYANYGEYVDYAGISGDGYDGTSFTSARVTAIVALMKGIHKEYTSTEIQTILDKYSIKTDDNIGAGVLSLRGVQNNSVLSEKDYPDIGEITKWDELSGEQLDEIFYHSSEYQNAIFWNGLSDEDKLELQNKSSGLLQSSIEFHDADSADNILITDYWSSIDTKKDSLENFTKDNGFCFIEIQEGTSISSRIKILINRNNGDTNATWGVLKKKGNSISVEDCENTEKTCKINFYYDFNEDNYKYNGCMVRTTAKDGENCGGEFLYCTNRKGIVNIQYSNGLGINNGTLGKGNSTAKIRVTPTRKFLNGVEERVAEESSDVSAQATISTVGGIECWMNSPSKVVFEDVGRYQFNYTAGSSVRAYFTGNWAYDYQAHYDSCRQYERSKYADFPGNSSGGYLRATNDSNNIVNTSKNIKKAYLMISSSADGYYSRAVNDCDINGMVDSYNVLLIGPKSRKNVNIDYYFYNYWDAHDIGFVDVTDFVKANGYGWYYVCNVPWGDDGQYHWIDLYAGWKLIVVEENEQLPVRATKLSFSCQLSRTENDARTLDIYDSVIRATTSGDVTGQMLYSIDGGDAGASGNFLRFNSSTTSNWTTWKDMAYGTRVSSDMLPRLITRNGNIIKDDSGGSGLRRVYDSGPGMYRYYGQNRYNYNITRNSVNDNLESIDVELIDVPRGNISFARGAKRVGVRFWTDGYSLVGTIMGVNYDVDLPSMSSTMSTVNGVNTVRDTKDTKVTGKITNTATNGAGYKNSDVTVYLHTSQTPTMVKGSYYNVTTGTTTSVAYTIGATSGVHKPVTFSDVDLSKKGSYFSYEIDCSFNDSLWSTTAYNYTTLSGYYSLDGNVSTKIVNNGEVSRSSVPYERWVKIDPNGGTFRGTTDPVYVRGNTSINNSSGVPEYFTAVLTDIKESGNSLTDTGFNVGIPTRTGYKFDTWEKTNLTSLGNGRYRPIFGDADVYPTFKAKWKSLNYTVSYAKGLTDSVSNPPSSHVMASDVSQTLKAYNENGLKSRTYNIRFHDNKPATAVGSVSNMPTNLVGNLSFKQYRSSENKTYNNVQSVKELTSEDTITMMCEWDPFTPTLSTPKVGGYEFKGWSDTPTGVVNTSYNTLTVSPGTTSFDKDLYAVWAPATYKITFDYNKPSCITTGTMTGNTTTEKSVVFKTAVGTLPIPKLGTSSGIRFDGWYYGDTQYTDSTIYELTNDITLKAKWSYRINFNSNIPSGASSLIAGTTASAWAEFGKEYNLTTNGFNLTGYSFGGWNTKANGTGTQYPDKTTIKDLPTTANEEFILYAVWKVNSYKIKYVLNKPAISTYSPVNGSGNPTSASYDTNISINHPSLKGWTFTGWKISGYDTTTAMVGGVKHTDTAWSGEKGTVFKNLTPVNGETVDFTANWSVNRYNIVYDLNKPASATKNPVLGTSAPTSANFDSTVSISNPKLTGWTFKG